MPVQNNTPKSQIRLYAVTGSIGDISLSAGSVEPTSAAVINAQNLYDILKHTAAAIQRIHGASSFTEAHAGVFNHQTSSFTGNIEATGSLFIAGTNEEIIDKVNGGSLTIRAGDLTGSEGKVKVILSGSDIRFDDGYRAGWANDIKFASSQNDWDRFKTIFGEASILQAVSNAASLPTDAKFMYKIQNSVSSPAVVTGDLIRQVNGTHFSGSYAAVPVGSRNENVDVFLNGQLLVSKSYDAINYDYDISSNGSSIIFNFALQEDDFISILVPQTVASVADYISANGSNPGSGGGGSETYSGTYTSTYVLRRTTTDENQAELTLDGAAPTSSNVITLASDSTSLFEIMVVGRKTNSSTENAAYKFSVAVYRDVLPSTIAVVGGDIKTIVAENSSGWDAQVSANTSDGALRVTVSGESSKTIKWTAFVREVKSVE